MRFSLLWPNLPGDFIRSHIIHRQGLTSTFEKIFLVYRFLLILPSLLSLGSQSSLYLRTGQDSDTFNLLLNNERKYGVNVIKQTKSVIRIITYSNIKFLLFWSIFHCVDPNFSYKRGVVLVTEKVIWSNIND